MKKLTFCIIAIVLLMFCIPYGIGYVIRSNLVKTVNNLNNSSEYRLKVVKKNLGWLQGDVLVKVQITDPDITKFYQGKQHDVGHIRTLPTFLMRMTFQNGPLLRDKNGDWKLGRAFIKTRLQFPRYHKKLWVHMFKHMPRLHGETFIGLMGDSLSEFQLNKILSAT